MSARATPVTAAAAVEPSEQRTQQPSEQPTQQPVDEHELLAHFDALIARGETIEPRDWMPDGYRRMLVRQIAQHAHSEIIGMQPEGALMFGPPDTEAGGSDARTAALGAAVSRRAMAWGIKRHTNDELRQRFVDQCVPQADRLGLTLPDPAIRWNQERGHYDFSPIDWDTYREALGDDTHWARQRIAHRTSAHEDGAWVREAAAAYAARTEADAGERTGTGGTTGARAVETGPQGTEVRMSRDREGAPASWEVFLRARRGLAHQHAGSVRAADPDAALALARDLYARRGDPLSLWVVRSDAVHTASPDERDPYFAGARHKPYRYPEHFAPLTEEGPHRDHAE